MWRSAKFLKKVSSYSKKALKTGPVHCSEVTHVLDLYHHLFSLTQLHKKNFVLKSISVFLTWRDAPYWMGIMLDFKDVTSRIYERSLLINVSEY